MRCPGITTKLILFSCSCFLLGSSPGAADTVYQTNSQGKEITLQRDAIVTTQDQEFVVYKHFDLKERRVEVVRLNRGSLPLRVELSNAANRAQIVKLWKSLGYKADIIDQAGKILHVDDVYLDFYPPGGHGSLLESIAPRTALALQIDSGGADEIAFEKIEHIEVIGERLSVALREGKTLSGKFLMPTSQPAEVRILGITEKYEPASDQVYDYSVPLLQLKTISFN